MSMVRALRTLTALENGTMSGAQLETQLSGSTARRGEFALLCASDGAAKRMAASAVTMTAVTASATAMAEFVKHTAARMAAWGSDNALTAIKASATAMAAMRGAGGYEVKPFSGAYNTPISVDLVGRAYILLGVSANHPAAFSITAVSRRGSSGMTSPIVTSAISSSAAQDSNQATPLNGPVVMSQNGGPSYTYYLGLLRCDA